VGATPTGTTRIHLSRVDSISDDFLRLLTTAPPEVGDVLDERYKIVERLGDGAMGHVFVAETVAFKRRVAVKLLRPELLASQSFRQRFQQEAEAIAKIDHPNVARFLDLVVGNPTFLVMEYVRGPTLDELLAKERQLPPERAAALAARLAWALEAAHQAGVIHRDIKPTNVIVSPDIERGEEPKLIDFGLAKLASQTSESGLTRIGQIVGTPAYMAPEQIAARAVDARADVYALGCLLYEMLAGRPPFAGADDVQVLYKQMHEKPPSVTALAPSVPRALEAILERAMAKAPEARFQSMREFAIALGKVAGHRTIVPAWPTVGASLPPKKRALALGALVAALLFAAVGIGFGAARIGRGRSSTGLLVLSTPSGAQVSIDGKAIGDTTPAALTSIAPGPHTVTIARPEGRGAAVERRVVVRPGEREVVNVVLPPASHTVAVHSVPEGATVYLDGRLVAGETPTTVEVTDDDFHELRVERTGFEAAVKPITPDDREAQITVSLQPERRPRGVLFVDSNTAAAVWLDGIDTGYTTPTLGLHVGVGNHVVEVRDGSRRASAKIHVKQGQTVRLLLTPTEALP
jgi:serine/threonine-protein kinase